MRRWLGTAIAATLLSLALGAPAASATFHLIHVREVFPGTAASPAAEYVELQMWAPDQNLVAGPGKVLHLYGPTGTETGQAIFPADVPGRAKQSTLVLATPLGAARFGIVPDAELPAAGTLDPLGGKVCWVNLDCVSWGSFSGSSSTPSPSGKPVDPGGIPDGMAVRRTIEPGCATLLEPGDDRDDSATDFFPAAPNPRPNSVAPTEVACAGNVPSQAARPETTLRRKPARRSRDRTPTFGFAADRSDASFECSLDGRPFRSCRSPFTAKALKPGTHGFRVRAVDEGGTDASPASCRFVVLSRPRG